MNDHSTVNRGSNSAPSNCVIPNGGQADQTLPKVANQASNLGSQQNSCGQPPLDSPRVEVAKLDESQDEQNPPKPGRNWLKTALKAAIYGAPVIGLAVFVGCAVAVATTTPVGLALPIIGGCFLYAGYGIGFGGILIASATGILTIDDSPRRFNHHQPQTSRLAPTIQFEKKKKEEDEEAEEEYGFKSKPVLYDDKAPKKKHLHNMNSSANNLQTAL